MESIYQSRGFVSCLKQGFTFVLANPKTVMKAMWVLLLIISISDVFLYAFAEKMSMDLLHLKIGTGTILATLGFYGSVLFQIFLSIAGLFYFGRYMVKSLLFFNAPHFLHCFTTIRLSTTPLGCSAMNC